jgi:Fungal N-terminal domain of STAND proteins
VLSDIEMDPLSITASVIAVIQITGTISSCCMQYIRSAKESRREALGLLREIGALQIILSTLENVATTEWNSNKRDLANLPSDIKGHPQIPVLQNLYRLRNVLVDCREKLEQVQRDLGQYRDGQSTSHPKRDAIIRSLKWPFKDGHMKNIMNDLSRYVSVFSLALSLDET